ncbi:MAG: FxLYD domain-containing protein, partial [Acidobacteriota bacterium]|nr:FxLYD domain-containing protein [Acidobacteriota bacterium]
LAEVGRHGGLVLLLYSKKTSVLGQVDDLMASFTGSSGTGDEQRLEWSGNQITAFAQVIKKGYVALAVTAADDCTVEPKAVPFAAPVKIEPSPQPDSEPETAQPAVAAAVVATEVKETPDTSVEIEVADFALEGRLKHAAAEDGWVDVMGVVVNNSGASYAVASFDLSLYDGEGELICVDAVSVNQLREGQERAFRGAIRCADYVADEVASWKLQFAGGH